MPVTVVVGGQFGSEGKGKVSHYFAREQGATAAVRVGGSNSGHTVYTDTGKRVVLRHLPTAACLTGVHCYIGAGSYIDAEVLLHDMAQVGLPADRLTVDPNASVITNEHKAWESQASLRARIGSTLSGTGAAVRDRVQRRSELILAKNEPKLAPFLGSVPVASELRQRLGRQERVLLEGTQGYGLSVLHSPYYPKATSRDTTAAAAISEAGVSPLDVDDVVLVIRAFPIRVPGESGELPRETTWDRIAKEYGVATEEERTSVTNEIRRVAEFDPDIVQQALEVNNPTKVVMNHADLLGSNARIRLMRIDQKERSVGVRFSYVGLSGVDLSPTNVIRKRIA